HRRIARRHGLGGHDQRAETEPDVAQDDDHRQGDAGDGRHEGEQDDAGIEASSQQVPGHHEETDREADQGRQAQAPERADHRPSLRWPRARESVPVVLPRTYHSYREGGLAGRGHGREVPAGILRPSSTAAGPGPAIQEVSDRSSTGRRPPSEADEFPSPYGPPRRRSEAGVYPGP